MRRSSFVVGSALLLAGGMNLLLAQHGGAGHSSGGHASASNSGFSSGMHSHPVGTGTIYPTHPAPIGLQPGFTGYPGINLGAIKGGYGRAGYGVGRGFRGGFYYLPPYLYGYGDSDYGYGYDNSPYAYDQPPQDYSDQAAGVPSNLAPDAQGLQNQEWQNERGAPYGPPIPWRAPYNAPPAVTEADTTPAPPVTLVLRDGKQVQLKSYAVMGQNIWDFSSQPAKRIALSNVDLNASRSATEASGGEFPEIH